MSAGPSHRLEELTAYFYGEDTPEARAAFEAHLAGCPECQANLARLRELIPKVEDRLRQPLDTSVDGMMRLMDRAERELQATRVAQREKRTSRRSSIIAGATLLLAAAATALVVLQRTDSSPNEKVFAPEEPEIDGG